MTLVQWGPEKGLSNTLNFITMKHFELKGQIRTVSNKAAVKAIRKEGYVPCNLYGKGMENILFSIAEKDLKGVTHTPESYIIDLVLNDGRKFTAIVHELQYHPIEDVCLHADFLVVDEKFPISMEIPVNIVGHAAGVRAGGKFIQRLRKLRVSGLMQHLPDALDIDITNLEIGKQIVAGELHYDNLTVMTAKPTIICAVKATRQAQAKGK